MLRAKKSSEKNLVPCPCCGYRTLVERGTWDTCAVCWWEDDGQDDEHADHVWGGPNGDVSLTEGRINFLKHGIFDPSKKEWRKSPGSFEKGRVFRLDRGKRLIEE